MYDTRLALAQLAVWWEGLPRYSRNGGLPAWGTVTAALVLLDRLRDNYSLNLPDHFALHSQQISRLGRPRVRQILKRFGVERSIPAEGGRTNMGYLPHLSRLLDLLAALDLGALSRTDRERTLTEMQGWLVRTKISNYPEV